MLLFGLYQRDFTDDFNHYIPFFFQSLLDDDEYDDYPIQGPISSIVLPLPTTTILQRIEKLEVDVALLTNKRKAISCYKEKIISQLNNSYQIDDRCSSASHTLNNISHHIIYNPLSWDQFIECGKNNSVIIGPKKYISLMDEKLDNCRLNIDVNLLRSHSFPKPPTHDNIQEFPGILIKKGVDTYDDTFSTAPPFASSDELAYTETKRPPCDVKCYKRGKELKGINKVMNIYGTNWGIRWSMEGEQIHNNLVINKNAWKDNQFYATTSFESEVPIAYFGFTTVNWNGTHALIQNDPVPFNQGKKAAVFLARNCGSRSKREQLVKDLMGSNLTVDSLSGCLNNKKLPKNDLKNKTAVMRQYLLYLAFENQRTPDYITEKLWGALNSGVLPVYFGAPNIKDHVPPNSVILVDDFASRADLAEHLVKVVNDKELYESYHEWRKHPLSKAFRDVYNFTMAHDACRICRFAFAKKYGIPFQHKTQTIEPLTLPRHACIKRRSRLLSSPAIESWYTSDARGVKSKKLAGWPITSNMDSEQSLCPLLGESSLSLTSDGSLTRRIWSYDGATDIYLAGKVPKSYHTLVLRLQFPIDHGPIKTIDSHSIWIQNNSSRVSLLLVDSANRRDKVSTRPNITAQSGRIEMNLVDPQLFLPLRIRIVIEDLDLFHRGASGVPSYYGKNMMESILNQPQLFALE